jgi:hypothetical protein
LGSLFYTKDKKIKKKKRDEDNLLKANSKKTNGRYKALPAFETCYYDLYLSGDILMETRPSFEERKSLSDSNVSYFDLGRKLKDSEWKELSDWRLNPENSLYKFKAGDRVTDKPNRCFLGYSRFCINGEQWSFDQGYFEPRSKKPPHPDPSKDTRVSFFNFGRRLTENEYLILDKWKFENPSFRWNRGDIHPNDLNLVFKNYTRRGVNGESWITKNQYLKLLGSVSNNIARNDKADPSRKRLRSIPDNPKSGIELRRSREILREKERKKEDPVYKMKISIRSIISNSFRSKSFKKEGSSKDILGLCGGDFLDYIKSLFEPWMNFENYGSVNGKPPTGLKQCWDIDHIIPLVTALTVEDVIKLNHYTNLQPLCSYENRFFKKDSIDYYNSITSPEAI